MKIIPNQGPYGRSARIMVATLLLLAADIAVAAELYRWVDDDGKVTYQDRPPPAGVINFDVTTLREPIDTKEHAAQTVVTLYRIAACEPCDATQSYLSEKQGIQLELRDPDASPDVSVEMIERFGKAEVPITVIGAEVVRGHNPLWLDAALAKAGYASSPLTSQSDAPPADLAPGDENAGAEPET